jgi:hypothetical protein
MAAVTITWKAFLRLVASQCEIEGEPRIAFLFKFEPCDPHLNPNGCNPVMLKRGDPDYDNHMKQMTSAYEKLCDAIGIEFKTNKKAEQTLAWLHREYENPSFITWWQEDTETHSKQLDALLRKLNYVEQKQKVEHAIQGCEIAKVVLVQANGTFTQRWLVKRLSLEVPNYTTAKGFSVSAKGKWDRSLSHFWNSLSKYADNAEAPEEIIQILCNRCRTKPLIMAIHGIQAIEPQTLQALLSNFWEALIQKLNEQSWCHDRCDCILFLTTNLESPHSIGGDYGVTLDPWDSVTVDHMQQWLKSLEVKQLLAQCSGENVEDACLDLVPKGKQPPDNLGPPEEMLTTICTTFELTGIAELESYWNIAS